MGPGSSCLTLKDLCICLRAIFRVPAAEKGPSAGFTAVSDLGLLAPSTKSTFVYVLDLPPTGVYYRSTSTALLHLAIELCKAFLPPGFHIDCQRRPYIHILAEHVDPWFNLNNSFCQNQFFTFFADGPAGHLAWNSILSKAVFGHSFARWKNRFDAFFAHDPGGGRGHLQ